MSILIDYCMHWSETEIIKKNVLSYFLQVADEMPYRYFETLKGNTFQFDVFRSDWNKFFFSENQNISTISTDKIFQNVSELSEPLRIWCLTIYTTLYIFSLVIQHSIDFRFYGIQSFD